MALLDIVKKGSTSRAVTLYVFDNTTGLPKTGLTYVSTGIALWYRREGAVKTTITPATLAALTTGWASGGFLEIGDGEYRLDVPDAAFATSANHVHIGGTFTGYTVVGGTVRLIDVDLEDTVRAGLTAIPNVASGSAGAIITSGTGTAQIAVSGGAVTTVTTTTNLTNAPTAGDLTSTMKASVATATLTTQITESYRANGAAPTLAQGVCEMLAHLGEAGITATTKTIYKFDHSTTAGTFTLNSGTTPTLIYRSGS